mgnify:CR=1 FL=1
MPNMDGLTLAEKIKKHFPHIQIIILTVNDSFGCAQQAINIGVDYYLLKPKIGRASCRERVYHCV